MNFSQRVCLAFGALVASIPLTLPLTAQEAPVDPVGHTVATETTPSAATNAFTYVRWLGDRKGIEEKTTTWDNVGGTPFMPKEGQSLPIVYKLEDPSVSLPLSSFWFYEFPVEFSRSSQSEQIPDDKATRSTELPPR
jgi:hypothetical protein